MEKQASAELKKDETLGAEIHRIREFLGKSEEEVAAGVGNGCTAAMIAQYESGSVPMETDTFFAVAETLGVTPNDLAPRSMREKFPCLFGYAKLNSGHREVIDSVVDSFLRDEAKRANG